MSTAGAASSIFYRPEGLLRPVSAINAPTINSTGEKSFPFPVWSGLLAPKHRKALGVSVWFFLWLLDRTTKDEGGWGIVLGGAPVTDKRIAGELGVHPQTVRADRKSVVTGKYVECTRTPYGFTYRVRNSRKFGIWGSKRVTGSYQSQARELQKPITPELQVPIKTKKTMQLDKENHPRKKRADLRFQQIVNHYFSRTKAIGIDPMFDASDASQLSRFLKGHPNLAVEKFLQTLDHAFDSSVPYPLRTGFRMRQFLAHQATYQLGPIHRNDISTGVRMSKQTVHRSTVIDDKAAAEMGVVR